LGVTLEPTRIVVADGTRVEIDGLTPAAPYWWSAGLTRDRPRSRRSTRFSPFLLTSKSWAAHALRDPGVTLVVVDLLPEVQEKVRRAQQRQYR
jgi:hypothetical protein